MNRSTFLKIALASATPVSAQTQKRGNEFLDSTVLSHSYQIIEAPHKLIMTLPPLIAIRSILLLTGVPGFGKLRRATSLQYVSTAILSRQTVGIRGTTLIVNLPGKPKSIRECLEAVFPAIPYCVDPIEGPFIEVDSSKIEVFRPKSDHH